MHSRNRYRQPYDLDRLVAAVPALASYIIDAPAGRRTVDFARPEGVRLLNKALLISDYGLRMWDLAPGALCPGVPGRLDYIHAIAELIGEGRTGATGLDVGTGSSLVYPILGVREYGWRFVAAEIEAASLRGAQAIVNFNPVLQGRVEVRRQARIDQIFEGVIRSTDRFAFTMCNPPFFASTDEATASAKTKWAKLGRKGEARNFGGLANELWTPGGEESFLRRTVSESSKFRKQVDWFTTLVSREAYVSKALRVLAKAHPEQTRVIPLQTGNKTQRILAWRWV